MLRSLRLVLPSLAIIFLGSAMLFFGRTSASSPGVTPGESSGRSSAFHHQTASHTSPISPET